MGGADAGNFTAEVLPGIAEVDWLEKPAVDVVLGVLYEHLEELKNMLPGLGLDITLHINTPKMAELMWSADLAVGAAGSATWERCCLGLPTISLELADNQHYANEKLGENGVVKLVDGKLSFSQGVKKAVDQLVTDNGRLISMSEKSLKLVDGKGTQRVIKVLMDLH